MTTSGRRIAAARGHFKRWFFEGLHKNHKAESTHKDAWWKVMCLTGVDYFSTLGYQPGIAFLAAGILSPLATLIVVLVTLFGLVPLYARVAKESPHGQGSIAMLENLLPGWRGKTLVLVLLGFAATDFVITITLSAADATAHIVQNPMFPDWLSNRVAITVYILAILGAVFLKGFREAIGLSVLIVSLYLACNAVVAVRSIVEIMTHLEVITNWQTRLFTNYHSIPSMSGISLILFPKLALGMSGFETGVAVMPLVKGSPDEDPNQPSGRIKNTQKLLLFSALTMALLLLISSIVTTLLIPEKHFAEGGQANGRALAYLAHLYFGETFGTIYDISTILILWFAGASAMAGLLNLVPRYLPRYGMAPNWAKAQRPLVVIFTLITFVVTILFRADVDAQAGAYATGVLVLFMSAAFAVVLASWNEGLGKRLLFCSILIVFIYTSIANMIERPEGLHIASFFIGTILLTSLISRAMRSLELRILNVKLDAKAQMFVQESLSHGGLICLLAHRPGGTDYAHKEKETRFVHKLTKEEASFIFLEVDLKNPSEFDDDCLEVTGHEINGFRVFKAQSPAIPNAIAALLLHLRDNTKTIPCAYFGWTEGHPISYVFKYIFLGEGETAPVTREILRELEKTPDKRPKIIVG
ncbi:MAG: amino acid transporter [Candidatus Melainabacteria bacterium]|nr:MAG: amino acid transporter [Candidatus Melainabacteria bacterium]